jgi:type II secretory pathway pseudopilin PulG
MILLALAIIVLLGFTALAVDLGMAYADRRQAQNAADAAALAGAQNAGSWIKANSGSCNGFGAAQKSAAQSAAAVAASKFYPSVTPTVDVSDCQNGQVGVTVSLSHTVHGAVFQRDTTNTVQAMVGVKTGGIADGFGLVSLADDCNSGGMVFKGNIDVTVTGGGIFSNSCIDIRGASGEVHAADNPGIKCHSDTGSAEQCYERKGNPDKNPVTPDPQGTTAKIDPSAYDIPGVEETCNALKASRKNPPPTSHDGGTYYDYGYYTNGINLGEGSSVYLNAGLYCIDGGIGVGGNNTISSVGGVTLYFINGGLDIGGNNGNGNGKGNGNKNPSKVTLQAPTGTTNYGVPGLLIYFAKTNPSTLDLRGTADSLLTGTILVPKGSVELGGNSTLSEPVKGQVIAYNVNMHGTPGLTINYDGSKTYKGAATLDLLR